MLTNRQKLELATLEKSEARYIRLIQTMPTEFKSMFKQKLQRLDFLRKMNNGELPWQT